MDYCYEKLLLNFSDDPTQCSDFWVLKTRVSDGYQNGYPGQQLFSGCLFLFLLGGHGSRGWYDYLQPVLLNLMCVLGCLYTVFQKKTPTHIVGYKLSNSCLILIIFDTEIPDII